MMGRQTDDQGHLFVVTNSVLAGLEKTAEIIARSAWPFVVVVSE